MNNYEEKTLTGEKREREMCDGHGSVEYWIKFMAFTQKSTLAQMEKWTPLHDSIQ